MLNYTGTIVLSSELPLDEARSLVNDKINNNLSRYKSYGVEVAQKENYVSKITANGDNIIVEVSIDYEGECSELDLDLFFLDGEIE